MFTKIYLFLFEINNIHKFKWSEKLSRMGKADTVKCYRKLSVVFDSTGIKRWITVTTYQEEEHAKRHNREKDFTKYTSKANFYYSQRLYFYDNKIMCKYITFSIR